MERTYSNPRPLTDLWDGQEIGDPFLMRHSGTYYLYCSSHGNGAGIKCWTSRDMMEFTYRGYVCEDARIEGAYAPEVCFVAGKFYMVTSPKGSGHYLLKADDPLGPFQVISENYGLGIDGSLFLDDDGREYFYRASAQGIRVHDMPTPDAIDPHSKVIGASYLGHWTEGPMAFRHGGRYFLIDTGNHVLSRGYHVDYFVSHEGPDRGFYALADQQLLLETREAYHALGHASICAGPDMDTLYIVYHKNILDEWNRPHHRSMCIDRLFFNGDRMYTNACWWRQKAPRLPDCACYDGEGLIHENGMMFLPRETDGTFTAELCGQLKTETGEAVFSRRGSDCLSFWLGRNGAWEARVSAPDQEESFTGRLPSAVSAEAAVCVKCSLRQGSLALFVNGLEILRTQTKLTGGRLGLSDDFIPGFMGFSRAAQGNLEAEDAKQIPGVFDACHALERPETREGEKRCAAALCHPGETLSFPVNVWKTGPYHVFLTVKNSAAPLEIAVNGEIKTVSSCGLSDAQGLERRYWGTISLQAGESVLTLRAGQEILIDRIAVLEAGAPANAAVIQAGDDVTGGGLQIIGHKAGRSMCRKFSGFTCAEGHGEAYFGGMARDYQVRAEIFMDPCSPDAAASIFLRSSRESWHPHQVACARRAYCVRVLPDRIELLKQNYHEKLLASAALDMRFPGRLTLLCRVQGNAVSVFRIEAQAEIPLISIVDPMAVPCGRTGIDASGDGIGFAALRIETLE